LKVELRLTHKIMKIVGVEVHKLIIRNTNEETLDGYRL